MDVGRSRGVSESRSRPEIYGDSSGAKLAAIRQRFERIGHQLVTVGLQHWSAVKWTMRERFTAIVAPASRRAIVRRAPHYFICRELFNVGAKGSAGANI
jgi:hypothetical protein